MWKKNILKTAPLIKFPILNNKESRLALLCKVDHWEPSEAADWFFATFLLWICSNPPHRVPFRRLLEKQVLLQCRVLHTFESKTTYYSWIEPPVDTLKNQSPQKPKGPGQIRDHAQKALGKESPDLLGPFLCDLFLVPFFKITFQMTSKQKWTRQNRIILFESSSIKISGPSEVPWFVGKWFL